MRRENGGPFSTLVLAPLIAKLNKATREGRACFMRNYKSTVAGRFALRRSPDKTLVMNDTL
jgi:hypothetical protein